MPLLLQIGVGASAFLALITFIGGAIATRRMARLFRGVSWRAVPAVIEQSQVVVDGTVHRPAIVYRYRWQGAEYRSTTISPDYYYSGSSHPAFAEKWVRLFSADTPVTAYVSDRDPAVAVLFPEYRYDWWHVTMVALAVFGMGMAVVSAVACAVLYA